MPPIKCDRCGKDTPSIVDTVRIELSKWRADLPPNGDYILCSDCANELERFLNVNKKGN